MRKMFHNNYKEIGKDKVNQSMATSQEEIINSKGSWLKYYDYFVDKEITYQRRHLKFLQFLKRSIDFAYLSSRSKTIASIGEEITWIFRVLHKYEFFNEMETIATGRDEVFNKTFDYVLDETLNWMTDDYFPDTVYQLKFTIMSPIEKNVEYQFVRRQYDVGSVRKLLLEQNVLFNLLITNYITINLLEII